MVKLLSAWGEYTPIFMRRCNLSVTLRIKPVFTNTALHMLVKGLQGCPGSPGSLVRIR